MLVERMQKGESAEIRLNAGEPLDNVPRSLRELGHEVTDTGAETGDSNVHRLTVVKR